MIMRREAAWNFWN